MDRLANIVALLLTFGLLSICCGCRTNGSGSGEGDVTFAKSFGGPGEDEAVALRVGPQGRINFVGINRARAIGGFEALPWAVGLDEIGDPRFQESLRTPTGVGKGVDWRSARLAGDSGTLFAGEAPNEATGTDVVLQRLDENGITRWTLELDSGDWNDTTEYDAGRPYANDLLKAVVGGEALGWFVVTQSNANIQVGSAGSRVYVDVPSIVIYFVNDAGTVVWRRRLLATDAGNFNFGYTGPYYVAAELTWGPRLTLLVKNLQPDRLGLTLVHFATDGAMAIANDSVSVPDALARAWVDHSVAQIARSTGGRNILQTSDVVDGTLDKARDDGFLVAVAPPQGRGDITLTKTNAAGETTWDRHISSEAFLQGLAQTFPDDAGSWLWVGGRDYTNSTFGTSKLWRVSLDGDIDHICDLGGLDIVKLSPTDGGQNLSVFLVPPNHLLTQVGDETYSDESVLFERVYDADCALIRENGPFDVEGIESLAIEEVNAGRVLSVQKRREGFVSLSVFSADGTESSIDPIYDWFNRDLNIGIDDRGNLLVEVPDIEDRGGINVLAEDGLITRRYKPCCTVYNDHVDIVDDGVGHIWRGDSGLTSYDTHGTVIDHLERGETVYAVIRDGDSVFAIGRDKVWEFQPRTQTATVSELPFDHGNVETKADELNGQILVVDPGEKDVIEFYGGTPETSWRAVLGPKFFQNELVLQVRDGVIAPAGGVVLLVEIRADILPEPFIDPGQTYGDHDVALLKMSTTGQPQWLRVYGAAGNEIPRDLERTPKGYAVLAESDSFDAVTPGSTDIWVLKTGLDGHIEADSGGNDACPACLGSLSGPALLEFLQELEPIAPRSAPVAVPYVIEQSEDLPVDERSPEQSTLLSENTARQCFGDATDIQEAPVNLPPSYLLEVGIVSNGVAARRGTHMGGSVHSSDGSISCSDFGTDCSEVVFENGEVELTATAGGLGFEFAGWTSDDPAAACAGATDPVITFPVTRGTSCTALFNSVPAGPTENVTVLFDQPASRAVAAIFDVSTHVLNCVHDCTVALPQSESPIRLGAIRIYGQEDVSFDGWSGCDAVIPDGARLPFCEIDITAGPRTVIAAFGGGANNYDLNVGIVGNGTVTSTPVGIDCGSDCSETYAANTSVSLTATPADGYSFSTWSGDCSNDGASPTSSIVMDGDRSCQAEFVTSPTPVFNLATVITLDGVSPPPGGTFGGTISSSPVGIVCGGQGSDCDEDYPDGTTVQLIATADSGYQFDSWSGDCGGTATTASVVVDADRQCGAAFSTAVVPANPTLAMVVNNGGYVGSFPAGIDCGNGNTDCVATFPLSTTVTLSAATNLGNGSTFLGFGGDCASPNPLINIVMDGNKNCTANYQLPSGTFSLTINVVGSGTVTTQDGSISCPGDCVGDYVQNTQARVIITSDASNSVTWGGDCGDLANARDFFLTMDRDLTCTATFDF